MSYDPGVSSLSDSHWGREDGVLGGPEGLLVRGSDTIFGLWKDPTSQNMPGHDCGWLFLFRLIVEAVYAR